MRCAEQARVEANSGFGREGGVCRRDQAPGEGSAGMRGAFGRRGGGASAQGGQLEGDQNNFTATATAVSM